MTKGHTTKKLVKKIISHSTDHIKRTTRLEYLINANFFFLFKIINEKITSKHYKN